MIESAAPCELSTAPRKLRGSEYFWDEVEEESDYKIVLETVHVNKFDISLPICNYRSVNYVMGK